MLFKNKQSFPKKERLNNRKSIQELFGRGQSAFLYPYKVLFIPKTSNSTVSFFPEILISVPKKRFKKAVDRNRLKRQIREAYRTQKLQIDFLSSDRAPQSMAFIYVGKVKLPYIQLEEKLKAAILKVSEAVDP